MRYDGALVIPAQRNYGSLLLIYRQTFRFDFPIIGVPVIIEVKVEENADSCLELGVVCSSRSLSGSILNDLRNEEYFLYVLGNL